MRNYLLLLLMVFLMTFSFIVPSASAKNYAGNTHELAIDYLVKKGALTADSQGNYDVRKTVTRGEFASYLAIVLQLPHIPEGHKFTDVPQNTATSRYIASATAAGIINGYPDETFKPDAYISRQHMATMLKRAMDYLKITPTTYETTIFADENAILGEHKTAVQLGAALNIIKGSPQKDGTYFMPQSNALVSQAASFIQRMMNVAGDPDAHIIEYKVANIINKEVVPVQTVGSLNDAIAAKHANQVILKDDKIIIMDGGTGFVQTAKTSVLKSTTINDVLSIAKGSQLELLNSDGETATVRIMGQEGTMPVADLDFYPFSLSKGRSYYKNQNGEIMNVQVDPKTGSAVSSFTFGTAPNFMQPGQIYYSWDGVNFTTSNGQKVGTYYNYYQTLPMYTKTAYTAEELDAYILQLLTERQASKNADFKDATTKSKLLGLGKALKEMEAQYNINAALMLGIAMNESAVGMSKVSQTYNNLFGLYQYDSNPLKVQFSSPEASIVELITQFLVPNYITPGGSSRGNFVHGAVIGSKLFGFNVKYASDPFWGQKAAAYYYRLDKALGGKDAALNYKVGLTTQYVNVRSVPTTVGNDRLFQYPRANYPVLILDESHPEWFKIISDVDRVSEAYINKQYVTIIETTK